MNEKNKAAQALRKLRTTYPDVSRNLATINAARQANAAKCTCGRTDGTHTSKCPAYAAYKQRESRARKKQQQA